jgi:hypothetical protein
LVFVTILALFVGLVDREVVGFAFGSLVVVVFLAGPATFLPFCLVFAMMTN